MIAFTRAGGHLSGVRVSGHRRAYARSGVSPSYLWHHGHPYAEKRIEGSGEAVDLVSLDPRQARGDAGGTAQGEGIRVRP